jgi:hypothetical protein
MELIETKEYKGFTTKFYLLPKTAKFLQEKNVSITDYIPDTFHWYEHELFDLLDPEADADWSEEKETRKHFAVYFYGIITDWKDGKPEGWKELLPEGKILNDSFLVIRNQGKPQFGLWKRVVIEK